LIERVSKLAESFSYRAQHEGQVSVSVRSDSSASGKVLAAQKLGPFQIRREHICEHALNKGRQPLDENP
jgi:hypothetical protein